LSLETAGLDDQEDIAEGVPGKSEVGPTDPKADGSQPSEADLASEPAPEAGAAETLPEPSDEAANAAPRLYQLRPAGLRPVRRRLRRHGLRNDCPPDQRRWPRPSPRTRLR
jgi:hypothetical protein